MRARLSVLYLVLGLALLPAWAATAAPPQQGVDPERPFPAGGGIIPDRTPRSLPASTGNGPDAPAAEPRTLNLNIVYEPPTLDPSLAAVWDPASVDVIEQLFIGLVDLDDETSEISPELATDWTVSLDGKVYTFTLRDDMTWSDGNPVTAEDVRYGILRTLDPATNSSYAYPLAMIIENAADYNRGTITDPDLVGFRIGLCGESPIRVGDHGPRAR